MSSQHHRITIAVTLALFTFLCVHGGIAEARGGGHGGGEHGGREHGGEEFGAGGRTGGEHLPGERRDGGHWRGFDRDRWNSGHWFHGDHLGRDGWWWVVGDDWYGYSDPYDPSAAAAGYWYYCGSAGAYYPYVATCPEGWTPVTPQ